MVVKVEIICYTYIVKVENQIIKSIVKVENFILPLIKGDFMKRTIENEIEKILVKEYIKGE